MRSTDTPVLKSKILLLSEEGILDTRAEPVGKVPFKSVSVTWGDRLGDRIAVIVGGDEIWTTHPSGWNRVATTDLVLHCVCWTADERLLVGTESARLAWVRNGELEFIESFDSVPERPLWYTPWGNPPDARSLSISTDGTIYVNVHVGWIVRSRDSGKTWATLRQGLDRDVHQVVAHPTHPATVSAATARGFFLSTNYGETFDRRNNGLAYHYSRCCACFPDKDVCLLSVSRGPHGRVDAQVYRSEDQGTSWQMVEGLPHRVRRNIDTAQIVTVGEGRAWVIIDDTAIYETNDYGSNWERIRDDYPRLFGIVAL